MSQSTENRTQNQTMRELTARVLEQDRTIARDRENAVAIHAQLQARVAELEEAFRRYAIHDETCDQEIYGAEACNCGYREVLLSLKP